MRCLEGLLFVIRSAFKCEKSTTLFQVRTGNQTQWITKEKWIEQMKDNEINKYLSRGNYYGSDKYKHIESITILPFSTFSSSKKSDGEIRKN